MEDEPQGRVFKSRVVRITELARDDNIVSEYVFDDCDIRGPAVIASLGSTQWRDNTIPASAFWLVAETQPLEGVLGVKDCLFERCRFTHISIVGTEEFIARFLND